MSDKIHTSEKKVISIAILVSAVHLFIIAAAALFYGLTVPDCLEGVKPFTEGSLSQKTDRHYELHMVARMWAFDPPEVVLPVGARVDVFVSSLDVTHGFHITGTNLNLAVVPGAVNYGQVVFGKPGVYPIVCNEYCGVAHHGMYGFVRVVENVTTGYLPSQKGEAATRDKTALLNEPPLVAQGRKLYQTKGCIACHSLDGSQTVGPSFKGRYGKLTPLTDGTSVTVDEGYLVESIKFPQKKIAKGFESILMPTLPVTEEEIQGLVEFIKSVN
jgi:cytochrome c oxidase subunit 2